jgi:tetratricopeptide (TPR) repeat protein
VQPDDLVILANAYRNRAGIELEWGRWGTAIADATAAIDLEPDDDDTLAWLHRIRGVAYMHRGRDDLAAPDFGAVAELSPDSAPGAWVQDQLREIESLG